MIPATVPSTARLPGQSLLQRFAFARFWAPGGMRRISPGGGVMLLLVLGVLTGCPSTSNVDKSRSEAFKQYETIIRWSQWDAAVDFIAKEYREENPISRLEMDRLRLFRVTNYTLRSSQLLDEGMSALQVVEISLFSNRQAVERTIIDNQVWRYNPESQRWKLHSGLPDPTQRD